MLLQKKTISIVIPVYNEEIILRKNVFKLFDFAKKNLDNYNWQIIISDNNSTDKTSLIAKELSEAHPQIKYLFLQEKGKGRAVMAAWFAFPADINIFMDADLATDISALPELVKVIEEGNDIAIGSRNIAGSKVKRPLMRKIISHILNLLLKISLGVKVHDTACGFKAINKRVLEEISPRIKNQTWFFDTELLVLAQKKGYKIKEVPVIWQEIDGERKSRGSVVRLMVEYLGGIARLLVSGNK